MTERTTAVERLLEAVPTLQEEGWVLTPFNTRVTRAGVVILVMRDGGEDLATAITQRLRELQPGLHVQVKTSQTARHVVVRL